MDTILGQGKRVCESAAMDQLPTLSRTCDESTFTVTDKLLQCIFDEYNQAGCEWLCKGATEVLNLRTSAPRAELLGAIWGALEEDGRAVLE